MTIFDYDDYRIFLKDYYLSQIKKRQGFSYRFFARKANLGSPSYLRMIIDGERNISSFTATKFSQVMGLTQDERIFFQFLVLYTHSKTKEEKNYNKETLDYLKKILNKNEVLNS